MFYRKQTDRPARLGLINALYQKADMKLEPMRKKTPLSEAETDTSITEGNFVFNYI
jgi:hypothetical protein